MPYRSDQTYQWNYDHAPAWDQTAQNRLADAASQLRSQPAKASYCGLPVRYPIAVAAGPLLNGRWCLAAAAAGFEVVTYKTTRTSQRDCYPPPNLTPIDHDSWTNPPTTCSSHHQMLGTWAVSFGMPSQPPEVWRQDVRWTRDQLPDTHWLCVSVVGTASAHDSLSHLAADYAQAAVWAATSGADLVELNFSCPNVSTPDGQLFQKADDAALVLKTVAQQLAHHHCQRPLLVKIGYAPHDEQLDELLTACHPWASAWVMTNSIASRVADQETGKPLFHNQPRGICGQLIRDISVEQCRRASRLLKQLPAANDHPTPSVIGVGGVAGEDDLAAYLQAGAEAVQVATAAMLPQNSPGSCRLPHHHGF